MKKTFDNLYGDFISFLLAYKFGTTKKNGETIILATEEEIQIETRKIVEMILKIGE